jgi:hypothetical protein
MLQSEFVPGLRQRDPEAMSAIFSDVSEAQCICIGSGRFLRCVLVPAMEQIKVSSYLSWRRSSRDKSGAFWNLEGKNGLVCGKISVVAEA